MTSPRQARVRQLLVAMLAIGFCLGALATTFLHWRRDVLRGGGTSAPQDTAPRTTGPPPMVAGPDAIQTGAAPAPPVVATAPTVGPATTPPDAAPSLAATGRDIDVLQRKALRMPIDGIARAALQQSFDQPRGAGRHEAIDILAPRGTPVHAVEAGTIGKLFTSERGGITVYQYDPSGTFCYYYAHLDRYVDGLREGQHVEAGTVLGYVGTTGNAPQGAPHLHFAIFRMAERGRWWEGTAIDPYLVLR